MATFLSGALETPINACLGSELAMDQKRLPLSNLKNALAGPSPTIFNLSTH